MGYAVTAECPLCGAKQCTLFHILAGCKVALTDGRYTWRHDSVLLTLKPVLQRQLDKQNKPKIASSTLPPDISKSFVKPTEKRKQTTNTQVNHLLSGANDWEMLVDFTHDKLVFPEFICTTSQRPDIVIFSKQNKTVFLIELTCPAEENIVASQIKKAARYLELEELVKQEHWSVQTITIEAGARGFVARSMNKCLRKLGLTPRLAANTCKSVSLIVARCSHTIWMLHNQKIWKRRQLLSPNPR